MNKRANKRGRRPRLSSQSPQLQRLVIEFFLILVIWSTAKGQIDPHNALQLLLQLLNK